MYLALSIACIYLSFFLSDDKNSIVVLNWQPPKLNRVEDLHGYLIYYTTNPQRKEWVEEVVPDGETKKFLSVFVKFLNSFLTL